jgi:hypothetical protein
MTRENDSETEFIVGTVKAAAIPTASAAEEKSKDGSKSKSKSKSNSDSNDKSSEEPSRSFNVFPARVFQRFKLVTRLLSGKSLGMYYQLMDQTVGKGEGIGALKLDTYTVTCPAT